MAPSPQGSILLLCCLASGCRAPDRWQTSVSSSRGSFDNPKFGDLSVEDYGLELGVSGPIWDKPERDESALKQGQATMLDEIRHLRADKVVAEKKADEIPWDFIITSIVLALGGAKGTEMGIRKYRRAKACKK